ncbi:MAG: hypothetical protein JKX97_06470 [Candidatus Lindowbacteria bacterium]|nr:hypothetical protein [Candidatus Lindowbacteria bacterium]
MKPNHKKALYVLVALFAIYIASFYNKQNIAPGDHGRDLYVFDSILKGETPYLDFLWIYGPLMPYVYAMSMKMFGITIVSAISTYLVLALGVSLLTFFVCNELEFSATGCFLAALIVFYDLARFFHTYNHIGATIFITLYFLFWIRQWKQTISDSTYNFLVFATVVGAIVVKYNMGLALLAISFVNSIVRLSFARFGTRLTSIFKTVALTTIPVVVGVIVYWAFLRDVPWVHVKQCFISVGKTYRVFASPIEVLSEFGYFNMTTAPFFLSIVIPFNVVWLISSVRKAFSGEREQIMFCLGFVVSEILLSHEFIMAGATYSLHYFLLPIVVVNFGLIGKWSLDVVSEKMSSVHLKRFVSAIVPFVALASVLILIYGNYYRFERFNSKINLPRANIFTTNPEFNFMTEELVRYIESNTSDQEKIMIFPDDALYYFLSNRENAA